MDTLQELCNAFKKIIIVYKNIKCKESNTLANESASLLECVNKTRAEERSKSNHLRLFLDVIQSLDSESKSIRENPPRNIAELQANIDARMIYKNSLIELLHELYKLNHTTYSFTSNFGGGSYTLSTTRTGYGYACTLTELGDCIREYLLKPLNASGVKGEARALTSIELSLDKIFDKINNDEEKTLLLSHQTFAPSSPATTRGFGLFDESSVAVMSDIALLDVDEKVSQGSLKRG